MMVADLNHFLDLPDDVPGPARRLAGQLGGIVRAATAGDAGNAWVTALPCPRRPGNRRCPGRMIVQRPEPPAQIRWKCGKCGDEGVISSWEDSPYDMRRRTPAVTGPVRHVTVTDDVASALRNLQVLDTVSERVVFAIRVDGQRLMLTATDEELDELIGFVAAEANNEPDRRRRQRLDTAFDALNEAQQVGG